MAVALARIRMPLLWGSIIFALVARFLDVPWWLPLGLLVVAAAVYVRIGTVRRPPVRVVFPVKGRYQAINSPADHVPSHRLHAYGQTYAIDLLHVPTGNYRPAVGTTPLTRPAHDFPGFGQPVVAPVDGTVTAIHDRARDHRSRTSWPALLYMFTVEAFLREVRGPKGLLGNHVIIRTDDGVFALVAHLRRGSVRVDVGQRVARGDVVAECGNSGNSTEPHVHFQLMDHPNPFFAAGLPLEFPSFDTDAETRSGVPKSSHPFTTP